MTFDPKETISLKIFIVFFAVFVLFSPSALAVNEVCPAGMTAATTCCVPPPSLAAGCPAGKVWIGSASGGGCRTPVFCPAQQFSCSTNACVATSSGTAVCPGQLHIGNNVCVDTLTVIRQALTDTVYKVWRGTVLGRLVTVPDSDCVDGQTPVWNNTTKAWACGQGDSLWLASGNDMSNTNTGKVGVGTATPSSKLHVKGIVSIQSDFPWSGDYWKIYQTAADVNNNPSVSELIDDYGLSFTRDAGATWLTLGNKALNASYFPIGNVGIGNNTPTQKLEVDNGDILVQGVGSFDANTETASVFLGDTNNWVRTTRGGKAEIGGWGGVRFMTRDTSDGIYKENMTIKPNGNWAAVGINNTDPGSFLDIGFNGTGLYGTILNLNQTAVGNSDGPKIGFVKKISLSPDTTSFWSVGILNGANVDDFAISEDAGVIGFGSPRLTVQAGGNVGIGTTTPDTKLDVNGQIKIRGGTPGAGKVLTSDANGLATWQPAAGGSSVFTSNNMYYAAPQSVVGYVTASSVKTLNFSGLTVGVDGLAVTGISGSTNYGGGSATSMIVRLYSGAHSASFIVAIPGGSTNQPFYIPLTIPAKFASSLSVDLTASYAFASIQVSDFSLEYTPLPL